MKTTITLRRDPASDSWTATWSGQDAAEIIAAFGTATIPTPYRCVMSADDVRARIASRNPGCIVVCEQEGVR